MAAKKATKTAKTPAKKKGKPAPKAKAKPASKAKSKPKAKSKSTSGRKAFISKAPVRRLMRDEGASLVSDGALSLMIKALEDHATVVTKKAIDIVKDDKRKRLTAEDISWALK